MRNLRQNVPVEAWHHGSTPSAATTTGFFANLVLRPQQGKGRAGSLPRDADRPMFANHATFKEGADEYFAQHLYSDECPQIDVKGRHFSIPIDETPVYKSQNVDNSWLRAFVTWPAGSS